MRQAGHGEKPVEADSAFSQSQLHARRKNRHANHHLMVIFCAEIKPVWVESFLRRSNSPEACPVRVLRQMRHVEIFLTAHFGQARHGALEFK